MLGGLVRTIAMMPIKLKNERLPGKNIRMLGCKPLLRYGLDNLKATRLVDEIYVYCSSDAVIPCEMDCVISFMSLSKKFLKILKVLSEIFR